MTLTRGHLTPDAAACLARRPSGKLARVRHAMPEDLDQLETLLAELRRLPGLRERRRGSFSRGSQAFLHFHADGCDRYVDVRLDSSFERFRVTSRGEQDQFLSKVRKALQQARPSPSGSI